MKSKRADEYRNAQAHPSGAHHTDESDADAYRPSEEKQVGNDFQSDITDTEPLRAAFMCKFAGWVEVRKRTHTTTLGIEEDEVARSYRISKATRYMNDDGASMLYHDCLPLCSRLTTSGTLDSIQIFLMWNGKITACTFSLLDNFYRENNTYEIRIEKLNDIVSWLACLSAITSKAKGGFTLREIAESFQTTTVFNNRGQEQQQKSEGIVERLTGGLFKR